MRRLEQRPDLVERLKKLGRRHLFWAWLILTVLVASWFVWDLIDWIGGAATP